MQHAGSPLKVSLCLSWVLPQWLETNPSNIRIFPADICFIAAWWYYTNGFYRCWQMLDGLVSSHLYSRQQDFGV